MVTFPSCVIRNPPPLAVTSCVAVREVTPSRYVMCTTPQLWRHVGQCAYDRAQSSHLQTCTPKRKTLSRQKWTLHGSLVFYVMDYARLFQYYFLSSQVCKDSSIADRLCQHVPKFLQKQVIIHVLFHRGKLFGSKIAWGCERAKYIGEVITLLHSGRNNTQFGTQISVTIEVYRSSDGAWYLPGGKLK